MKKFSILLATLAIILAGCSKDEAAESSVAFVEGQKVTLTASVIDNATRATSTYHEGTDPSASSIETTWDENDKVKVTVDGTSAYFTVTKINGSEAEISGFMPASGTTFDIQYPADDIDLSSQNYVEGKLPKDKLLFTATNCTLDKAASLSPQSSVLVINLYGDKTVSKIEFKKGSDTYTLNVPGGVKLEDTKKPFFMVVPTGTYKFTVNVYDNTPAILKTYTTATEQEISTGKFLDMPSRILSDCFYFEAVEDGGQPTLKKVATPTQVSLMYLTEGDVWKDVTVDEPFPATPLKKGERVYVKAKEKISTFCNQVDGKYYYFSNTKKVNVGGNINYLLDGQNPSTAEMGDNCFSKLFYKNPIVDASQLELPATTLKANCYRGMFYKCTNLTGLPNLPATTLADNCYYEMFKSCTSIAKIPDNYLPAEEIAPGCYYAMFSSCNSLTSVPAGLLPAKTLKKSCYYRMFESCSSLTNAPNLPATTLDMQCYTLMFSSCSKLEVAITLPATELKIMCYAYMFDKSAVKSVTIAATALLTSDDNQCCNGMFKDCSKLTYIEVAFTSWNFYATINWVNGVPSSGTFKCPSGLSTSIPGVNSNPSGWTVVKK